MQTTPDQLVGVRSIPTDGIAAVFGASGGIGSALADALQESGSFREVIRLSRTGPWHFDLLDETSIAEAAAALAARGPLRLVLDATGFLHDGQQAPEKGLRDLDATALARSFALNAIGPALIMKHVLPLLPRAGKSVFATLSARVGSIGDNRLGGWYGYRASKAALNQLLVTASVETRRRNREAICLALHPGTVDTSLSAPFAKDGLEVQDARTAARRLLAVVEGVDATRTGAFLDHHGAIIPW